MFDNFWGNPQVTQALEQMVAQDRLAQTLLFAGPEGVGKATLARRLGERLLPRPAAIEQDDLSLEANRDAVTAREKWAPDKRNQDPLLFSSHPDFVTFAPDGPLRQITIQQARELKERAPFLPHQGARRIFLIAENAYDLLPTIRSRAVPFQFTPLGREEMEQFVRARGLDRPERRVALAAGSPGVAVSIDLDAYDKRRASMLTLAKVAAGAAPYSAWLPVSETIARSKSEKLELHLEALYGLLRDLLILREGGGEIRNQDIRRELEALAGRVEFAWIRRAVAQVDEIARLLRRNIQKSIALDSLIVTLRA
jgi:DNA polymerase-3 subunit delta'